MEMSLALGDFRLGLAQVGDVGSLGFVQVGDVGSHELWQAESTNFTYYALKH